MTDYSRLNEDLYALIHGVRYQVTVLSNAASLLFDEIEDINWAGFYLLKEDNLILGPFQGKPACMEIPVGRGVCGTSVSRGETVIVPDVHSFDGHIACDSASNSEIVVPLQKNGVIVGVLDIDSPLYERFTGNDRTGLEKFSEILCDELFSFENDGDLF